MEQQVYSVRSSVGGLPVECFLSAHTFFEHGAQRTFSEDHVHACFELLLCRRGTGFQFVDGKAHAYSEGSVFVLKPFVTHAHIGSGGPEVRYSIRFILPEGQELSGRCEPLVAGALRRLRENGYFEFQAAPELLGLIDSMAAAVRDGSPGAQLVLGGLLSALLSYVVRELGATFEVGPLHAAAADNPNLRKFLIDDFFDQLIDSNARMEDLCSRVHLSQSQLNRVIRELYGTTFKQRMIDVRLAYIKYFLKYSSLSVHQIAQRTGFQEDGNLSLFFKQHCGMSPTQYRLAERAAPGAPERTATQEGGRPQ